MHHKDELFPEGTLFEFHGGLLYRVHGPDEDDLSLYVVDVVTEEFQNVALREEFVPASRLRRMRRYTGPAVSSTRRLLS